MHRSRWLTGAGLVLLSTLLPTLVLLASSRPGALDLLRAQHLPVLAGSGQTAAEVLTQLGSGAVLYPVLLALAFRRRSRLALLPVGVLAGGQVIEALLTAPLHRPSSSAAWDGLSSGHTSAAVLGWGLVLLQVRGRRAALGGGLAAGVVVGMTRVLLGLHTASDVMLGATVGLLLLVAALAVVVATQGSHTGLQGGGAAGLPRPPADSGPDTRREPTQNPLMSPGRRWRDSPAAWWLTAVAALVALVPPRLEPASHRLIDLAVYVGSGGVAGGGEDVYGYRTVAGLPFTYPPFAAVLAEPLSRVPLALVQVGWTAATLAALYALARTALRPVTARLGMPVTLALLLLSTPVRSHLRFGQVGVFLVLLVAFDLLGTRRYSCRLAGCGLGLATAVKLTPAVFLPWLLLTAPRRGRAAVLWAGGATLAGMVLLWPSSPTWLSSSLLDSSRFGRNDAPGNQSVRGMLLRSGLSAATAERCWLVAALVLLLVGTVGAVRLERAGQRWGAVGVLAATSTAVSPISWQHHLVWLVLPLAALVAAGRGRLAAGWTAVLIVPVTTIARTVDVPVLGALLVDLCGLTAVACVLLLPSLLLPAGRLSRPAPGEPVRSAG